MKSRLSFYTTAIALVLALAVPIRFAAQEGLSHPSTHYGVIDLGTLGGTSSGGNAINNRGWVTGSSNITGDTAALATLWRDGQQIPLGTLGGPSSNVAWPVKNNFGLISGITENGIHDPLGETFSCPAFGFSSGNSCVAFAWFAGKMTQLPGLGGNNSVGGGDNDWGQIVGWAENNVHDPTCAGISAGNGADPPGTQFLQFEATLWERNLQGNWQVRQLPPFPGDSDGAATAINDLGQVVGISGRCDVALGSYSAIHAVLWQNGKPISLGTLGGSAWNTPEAINNRGVVVGFDNGPNDVVNSQLQFRFLAFIWTTDHGMQSLGTLPGDAMSEATDINDENQIVGVSYTDFQFGNPRAFLYESGKMIELNNLLTTSAQSNFFVFSTGGINDSGQIGAQAFLVSNGVVTGVAHAVLLIPTEDDFDGDHAVSSKPIIPDDVAKQMQLRTSKGRLSLLAKP